MNIQDLNQPFRTRIASVLLSAFLLIHFGTTFLFLSAGLFHLKTMNKITSWYIIPFFEQNWGMFSVPGNSDRSILFQYRLVNHKSGKQIYSEWLDINKPLRDFNRHHYFSIAQRLMKYTEGCINDIYWVAGKALDECAQTQKQRADSLNSTGFILAELNNKSLGYASLRSFARRVYFQSPFPDREKEDSLTFSIKILEDAFPDYINREKDFQNPNNHRYSEFIINHASFSR
jgi:hypothetical protein